MTSLMYNRLVSKCDVRVEAYGTVDELDAALGMARAAAEDAALRDNLLRIQRDLIVLMGELATAPEDLPRYLKGGFSVVNPEMTVRLDGLVKELEASLPPFKDWMVPGADKSSAALHMARVICRRAERRVCALQQADARSVSSELVIYLNRLSDVLWLLAKRVEARLQKE